MKEFNSGKKGKICEEDTVDGVIHPIPVSENYFLFLNKYLILSWYII